MLNFKNKSLTLFLILSSHFLTYAQFDFREGYLINNDNDSIFGLIDYKGNLANAKKCLFKKSEFAESIEYSPNEIKSFKYKDSKFYISRTIVLNGEKSQLFLEFLVNGIVDVFYYRDNGGEHYLVDKGDGKLLSLKNEEKQYQIGSKKYVRESKEYIGILKYTFSESPTILNKASQTALTHKSLIKLASDYHYEVCTTGEECLVYEKELPKAKTIIGILFGVEMLSIGGENDFKNEEFYFRNHNFQNTFHPFIGIFLHRNLPYLNERISFQYEGRLSYGAVKSNHIYRHHTRFQIFDVSINAKRIGFSNSGLIRYEFPNGKVRPVIIGGGFASLLHYSEYSRDQDVSFYTGEFYRTESYDDNPFRNYDLGFVIGFGIISKSKSGNNFIIDLKYQKGNGLHDKFNSNYMVLNIGFPLKGNLP